MFEKILIATDDSQLVKNAMRYTAVAFPDSQYHLLNVIDTSEKSVPKTKLLMKDLKKASKKAVQDGISILNETGIHDIKKSVKKGNPGKEILKYAEKNDIELIVMGTQSKSGTQKFEIGKTCLHVLEHTRQSVLLFDSMVDIKKPKKILHPSGGCMHSLAAGYIALELAEHFDGKVEVLSTRGGGETEYTFKRLYEFAKKNHIPYKLRSCAVKPLEEIVEESRKYDLIVASIARPGLKYDLRKIYPPFALGKLEREVIVETKDPILFVAD